MARTQQVVAHYIIYDLDSLRCCPSSGDEYNLKGDEIGL